MPRLLAELATVSWRSTHQDGREGALASVVRAFTLTLAKRLFPLPSDCQSTNPAWLLCILASVMSSLVVAVHGPPVGAGWRNTFVAEAVVPLRSLLVPSKRRLSLPAPTVVRAAAGRSTVHLGSIAAPSNSSLLDARQDAGVPDRPAVVKRTVCVAAVLPAASTERYSIACSPLV